MCIDNKYRSKRQFLSILQITWHSGTRAVKRHMKCRVTAVCLELASVLPHCAAQAGHFANCCALHNFSIILVLFSSPCCPLSLPALPAALSLLILLPLLFRNFPFYVSFSLLLLLLLFFFPFAHVDCGRDIRGKACCSSVALQGILLCLL